jgi:hypothetical protein
VKEIIVALTEKHIVILRDEAGNTYVVDHVALQETRVPEERKAEVEEALEGRELVGGGLMLEPTKSTFKVVGAYTVQHTGGSQPPENPGEA